MVNIALDPVLPVRASHPSITSSYGWMGATGQVEALLYLLDSSSSSGDTEALLGQQRIIISPVCPWSAFRAFSWLDMPEKPPQASVLEAS